MRGATLSECPVGLFCTCHACRRHAVLPITPLIEKLDPAYEVPAVRRLLKCSVCGSRDCNAMPNPRAGLGVVTRAHW